MNKPVDLCVLFILPLHCKKIFVILVKIHEGERDTLKNKACSYCNNLL